MSFLPKRFDTWSRRSLIFVGAGTAAILILLGTGAALFLGAANGPAANVSSVNLQKGLVRWYRLNGNANDSTPYHQNGTVSGATLTTDEHGKTNGAYYFDGSDTTLAHITIPNVPAMGTFSLSAWVYNTAGGDTRHSILRDFWEITGTQLCFWSYNFANTYWRCTASGTVPTGQWSQIVTTWDGSIIRHYVNGALVWQDTQTSSGTSQVFTSIGGYSGRAMYGSVSDLRIYNRTLSDAEAKALYDNYGSQISAASGDSGLIGQYKLDGNANDSSPYRHNTVVNGTGLVSDREGKVNSAYSFNGTTDYIRSDTYPTLGTSNHPYSFTGWFNASSLTGSIIHMSASSNGGGWCLPPVALNAGHLVAYSWNSGLVTATGATSLSTSKWYHFAVTWDATNGLRVYLNGVLDGSAAQAAYTASGTSNYLYLGYENTSICNYRGPYAGYLDDIRVYSTSLSASAIAQQYSSYNSQVTDSSLQKGLIGDWEMNGNSLDSTPYRDNGTITGATLTTDRRGRSNSAYSFDGATNYISAATLSMLNTGSVTVSSWFDSTGSTAARQEVFCAGEGSSTGPILAADNGSGSIVFWIHNSGGWQSVSTATTFNTWQHVVGTYDGATMALYVNGVLKVSAAKTGGGMDTPNNITTIGQRDAGNTYWFKGSIDNVNVWNRALAQTEITALHSEYK